MKKIILLMAMAFAGAGAYAQISSGTMMAGGEVFFQSANNGGGSESVFGLDVNGGYFIMDDFAIGARIGFTGEDKGGIRTGRKSDLNFGVFGRKYFNLADNFYLWGGLGVNYNMGKVTVAGTDADVNMLNVAVTPGFAWFPHENWGIHMSLGDWIYFRSGSNSVSAFGINPAINGLGLGVNYFIRK